MQYVRSISGSVSKTWNSINPATLSGAIDVIVVELEDGSLACSPFHVRFGKFSLLRPYEKKVEFTVNEAKQNFAMKLGEGGEAFFVFETSHEVPESLQTSPLVSPALRPKSSPGEESVASNLQEPDYLDLDIQNRSGRAYSQSRADAELGWLAGGPPNDLGNLTPLSRSVDSPTEEPAAASGWERRIAHPPLERSVSDLVIPASVRASDVETGSTSRSTGQADLSTRRPLSSGEVGGSQATTRGSNSPPPLPTSEAVNRAVALSKKLSTSNIRSQVNESGDLMLDMTGYKTSEEEALRAEVIARKLLAEEVKGNYDIGALIGADEHGNLWVYSSEEAKEAAGRKSTIGDLSSKGLLITETASDPGGYQSDEEKSSTTDAEGDMSDKSDRKSLPGDSGLITPPQTPPDDPGQAAPESRTYAKTLRLTSDQLKSLGLRPGQNSMKFSVNKASCTASMYFWKYHVPIVISDIDGTITKSDALGHVLNMIGRDWTHLGVAKLYSDIVANGYHIMYLTSRSVGQADTTRNYLNSVVQDNYRLPKGPVILSPDRTIAALRREVYLRKPEVFKMACLRDIYNLFGPNVNPFYAGFGNRLTDALSYRSVTIPSTRIFTINSNAEVSLDVLSLNKYKSSYVTMRELVDHFFPAIDLLAPRGGESYTDFNYWREEILDPSDFSASESSDSEDGLDDRDRRDSIRSEDEGSDEGLEEDEREDLLESSYLSQDSVDDVQQGVGTLSLTLTESPEEHHENVHSSGLDDVTEVPEEEEAGQQHVGSHTNGHTGNGQAVAPESKPTADSRETVITDDDVD
ncbi:MAG: hypothetical protein M1823_002338 [Watsoniomyces obsoletus]|nr:MAG: hypothetical protein M1823_002338 [Watsoniomyces obsoletus]